MGDKLLTISQAARALDIAQNTLRAWADDGRIPVVRSPTGQRRFRLEDVERLMTPTTTPLMSAPLLSAPRAVGEPRPMPKPPTPLPTDRKPTPEEEAGYYVRSARWHRETADRMVADLMEQEASGATSDAQRGSVARLRKQYERTRSTLDAAVRTAEADYLRIVERPFAEDEERHRP